MKWLSDQNLHSDGWRNVSDPKGDILQPRDAGALRAQIGLKVVEENAASQAALEGGTTKEKLAELQDKAEFREAGHTFLPWLNDAKGDPGLAMKNMQDAAKEIDSKTGRLTGLRINF